MSESIEALACFLVIFLKYTFSSDLLNANLYRKE